MGNGVMTATEELRSLLFEDGAKLINVKCFRGDGVASTDRIRAELHSALTQKLNGSATVSDRFADDAPRIDVRAWVAQLDQ